jgi:hypothetical protein
MSIHDLDTAPLLATLRAYRSNDVANFKSAVHEMDQPRTRNIRWTLYSVLALSH